MGVDNAGRSVKAGIGNSPNAHFAIVVGHVAEQPIDRVVHVGAVVHVLVAALFIDVWAHLNELAFRHVAPAHVLVDENVTGALKRFRGPQRPGVLVLSIRAHAVRRAIHQEGIGDGRILGHVNGREQVDAVPHGDAVFVLGVMLPDIKLFLGLCLRPRARQEARGQNQEQKGDSRTHL